MDDNTIATGWPGDYKHKEDVFSVALSGETLTELVEAIEMIGMTDFAEMALTERQRKRLLAIQKAVFSLHNKEDGLCEALYACGYWPKTE